MHTELEEELHFLLELLFVLFFFTCALYAPSTLTDKTAAPLIRVHC